MTSFDVAAVRAGLELLRRRDPRLKIFGAVGHKYRLAPRLDEKKAVAFEKGHRVTLPEEYRRFLTRLGNGGAGPFYGIFALGNMDDGPWVRGFVGNLGVPFPHTTAWNLPQARLWTPQYFETEEAEHEWSESLDAEYWNPAIMSGAVPICEHGCALRTWLVVKGPEHGHVWFDARVDHQGVRPHEDATGHRMTFGAWYERWLAESLAALERPNR
ncbi:MAG: SMI1/KNR4 family protein [Deltaproteobacteria bacterium]|nr:SMI1/KNR4 family protein [Deltaproteobacteria bacterium]